MSIRIVYMGTPEFAVPPLELLVSAGYEVVGVVTAPDKPAGRGQKLTGSAVKEAALRSGLQVLQPTSLKDPLFLAELTALRADVFVVVAFRMLPEVVWSLPPLGTFNLHASLLPAYRGAAPIHWAVINGEVSTGLTTFFITREIDTGAIIAQVPVPIPPEATTGQLHDAMLVPGAQLVLDTVRMIEAGTAPRIPQAWVEGLPIAPKLTPENTHIRWERPTDELVNFVRGLSPHPAAWTTLDDKKLKLFRAVAAPGLEAPVPGRWHADRHRVWVGTAEPHRPLEILELQLEGRKRMTAAEFLRGYAGSEICRIP
jgi:methionyl-tRNA formyltransferase